jgi:hypothetical protein
MTRSASGVGRAVEQIGQQRRPFAQNGVKTAARERQVFGGSMTGGSFGLLNFYSAF